MPPEDYIGFDASNLLLYVDGKEIGKVNALSTATITAEPDPTPRPTLPITLSCSCRPVPSKGNADGCNSCKHLRSEYNHRDPSKFLRFYCAARVYRPCPGREFKFYLKQSKPPCEKYEPYKD